MKSPALLILSIVSFGILFFLTPGNLPAEYIPPDPYDQYYPDPSIQDQVQATIEYTGGVDLLLVTSPLIRKVPEFDAAVEEYITALSMYGGMTAQYAEIEVESYTNFGERLADQNDWESVRIQLERLVMSTGARYILILGGPLVVPRPFMEMDCIDLSGMVRSDALYVDFNRDGIVDGDVAISRIPDVAVNSSIVVTGLRTASALHQQGGFTMDNPVDFSSSEETPSGREPYHTPPYGDCDECDFALFTEVIESSDYITFWGHGFPNYLQDFEGTYIIDILSPRGNTFEYLDMSRRHPVVLAWGPCKTGSLCQDGSFHRRTIATEMIRVGAGLYIGRTESYGTNRFFRDNFITDIESGSRCGEALFRGMHEALLPENLSPTITAGWQKMQAIQLTMYGDPTLRLRGAGPEGRSPDPNYNPDAGAEPFLSGGGDYNGDDNSQLDDNDDWMNEADDPSAQYFADSEDIYFYDGDQGDALNTYEMTKDIPGFPDVVINEINQEGLNSWIELRNLSPHPIYLKGWQLKSGISAYVFPAEAYIAPDGFIAVKCGTSGFYLDREAGSVKLCDGDSTEIDALTWGVKFGEGSFPAGYSLARNPKDNLAFAFTPYPTLEEQNRFPSFEVSFSRPMDGEELDRDAIHAEWNIRAGEVSGPREPDLNRRVSWTLTVDHLATGERDSFRGGPGPIVFSYREKLSNLAPGSYRLKISATNALGQSDEAEVTCRIPVTFWTDIWARPPIYYISTLYDGWVSYRGGGEGGLWRVDGGVWEFDRHYFYDLDRPLGPAMTRLVEDIGCNTFPTDDDDEIWRRVMAVCEWFDESWLTFYDDGSYIFWDCYWPWGSDLPPEGYILTMEDLAECYLEVGGIFLEPLNCVPRAETLTSLLYVVGISPDKIAMASSRFNPEPVGGGRHYFALVNVYDRWLFFEPNRVAAGEELSFSHPASTWGRLDCDYSHPETIYLLPGSSIEGVPLVEW